VHDAADGTDLFDITGSAGTGQFTATCAELGGALADFAGAPAQPANASAANQQKRYMIAYIKGQLLLAEEQYQKMLLQSKLLL
jgi:hypothetical protein